MKDRFVLILFLLMPFAFISPGLIHGGHQFFFMLSALAIVGFLCKNKWIQFFLIYIAGWQLFLFVNDLITIDVFARKINSQISSGLMQVLFALCGAVVFLWIANSKIKLSYVFNIICISTIIQSLIVVSQLWIFDPVLYILKEFIYVRSNMDTAAIVGTLGNPNFLAAYLAISLPFFFRKYWCYFIPVITLLLILSKTSAAVIPAIIGTVFYFGYIKWLPLAIIPCVIYAIYDGSKIFQTNARYQWWIEAIRQLNSPIKVIFGLGPAAPKVWADSCPMHNEWLTIIYQYGIVGFSLFTGFVLTIYKGNRRLFSAFIIACINMIGNYPLHLAPSAFLIIIIVGLMQREGEVAHA